MALEVLSRMGQEVEDHEQETFLLFSQSIPSQNLGFVDAKAAEIELSIAGRDLTISQSPSILSSNRSGGTTGAVVWKVTPLFASWLCAAQNVLFESSLLDSSSTVLELGCGISGIVALALGPRIGRYIATDQGYLMKLLRQNITRNTPTRRPQKGKKHGTASNIEATVLDWEQSAVTQQLLLPISSSPVAPSLTAVLACDCIYNEALIPPFVQTCSDACRLSTSGLPALCIIAQQLRSPDVFSEWLAAFMVPFRVWRLNAEVLSEELRENSGFVVHIGVLRE
ncbi:MAG: hypothetical protein M1829_002064 [Trizodia sp. TS-e1964]|nr:MAG: hypothetical protein M1829_002064 [Trizodia sp. TS-e1964]